MADQPRMLDRTAVTSAYADQPDLVTAYAVFMTRNRLALTEARSLSKLASFLTPAGNPARTFSWTWRAADGTLLRRLPEGGFSLVLGDCLQKFCPAFECHDAGWPVFICDDGRERKMSAPEFSSVTFDGVVYHRLSAAKPAREPAPPGGE